MMRGYGRRWQRCHRLKSHEHQTRRMPEVFNRSFCYIQQPGSRRSSVHSESVDSERGRQTRNREFDPMTSESGHPDRDSRAMSATKRLSASGSRNTRSSALAAWFAIAAMRIGRL